MAITFSGLHSTERFPCCQIKNGYHHWRNFVTNTVRAKSTIGVRNLIYGAVKLEKERGLFWTPFSYVRPNFFVCPSSSQYPNILFWGRKNIGGGEDLPLSQVTPMSGFLENVWPPGQLNDSLFIIHCLVNSCFLQFTDKMNTPAFLECSCLACLGSLTSSRYCRMQSLPILR